MENTEAIKRFSFLLPLPLYERLEQEAARQGSAPVASVVRKALEQYLP